MQQVWEQVLGKIVFGRRRYMVQSFWLYNVGAGVDHVGEHLFRFGLLFEPLDMALCVDPHNAELFWSFDLGQGHGDERVLLSVKLDELSKVGIG